MPRLIKTLTITLGVLIGVAGGGIVLIQATGGEGRTTAAISPAVTPPTSATSTTGGSNGPSTVAPTTPPGGPSTASGTTAANPSTTTALSPQAKLIGDLDAALAGTDSCLVVENGAGQVVYQHQANAPLIPASTQKLLVAVAALSVLGPNYRFTTKVVAPARPVNGNVAGLWLVGQGDPLLASPEFAAAAGGRVRSAGYPWTPLSSLADQLVTAGVKLVPGGIRGDDTYEDRLRTLPTWPASYQQQGQIGLLSALGVNEGIEFSPPKTTIAQDPPTYAASELARLLQARQVPAGSQPDQAAPSGAVVLASVQSAPLSQIIEAMVRASDNWIAELLTRAIDKVSGGTGTTAGGVATVMRDAASAGLPLTGVQMVDGSGLSRTDRATCTELLAALDLGNQPTFAPILSGLAVAGQTGTLATRFRGTPLVGKLRAKTGSLDGVGGITGIVGLPATVRFAFLENDPLPETAIYAKEDAVAAAVGTYSMGA